MTTIPPGATSTVPAAGEPLLPRSLTLLVGVAATVVAVAGVQAFSGTLGSAFLAVVLVVSVYPVRSWLSRRGVPAWVSVIVLVVLVYGILLALIVGLAYAVAQLAGLLPGYSSQFNDLLKNGTGLLHDLGIRQDQVQSALGQVSLSSVVGPLQQVLGSVTGVLSNLAFIVTLVLFLAMDAAGFTAWLARIGEQRPDLSAALRAFTASTRRYVLVSTAFGLVVAAINVAELYWLAVPLPLLWGLLSFITNYVPNIGFVLGVVPPALLALLEGGVGRMVAVIVAYSVTNLVVQTAVQPKVVGDNVGLSPTLTFLSLVFWAFAIGPLGALLAVPLSLLVKALLVDADPSLHWLLPLLTGRADREQRRRTPG